MFKWFKWFKKKEKSSIILPSEDALKGLAVASMRYVVDKEGTVYLDFFWDNDLIPTANEAFAVLFSQINSGDLLEESIKFIEETLKESGDEEEFRHFFVNVVELQKERIKPFLESFSLNVEKTDDEVVVKPTDIAHRVFRGNQT